MIANILSIAGSDPSGGAGIQADIKAISANGGYAMAALTALTAQNTQGVRGVHPLPPDFVVQQIETVFEDVRVDAVKIGMLGSADVVRAVAETLQRLQARNIVLDPVMVAKGGDRLLAEDAVAAMRSHMLPLARIITPNLPEAAALLEMPEPRTRAEMPALAQGLYALGAQSVLLKGGHLGGTESPDYLLTPDASHWFEAPRIETRNTHGTGCTLSSAVAARAAVEQDISQAVEDAKLYLSAAIAGAERLSVGHGHGPVLHFPD